MANESMKIAFDPYSPDCVEEEFCEVDI